MKLRNVPAFGLGNHREQSNSEIQQKNIAQSNATPLSELSRQKQQEIVSVVNEGANIFDSNLSKGIDAALTGTALVVPATRPAIATIKIGKEIAESVIEKFSKLKQSDANLSAKNAFRDAEHAKFFSENDVKHIANQELRNRMQQGLDEPSPQ